MSFCRRPLPFRYIISHDEVHDDDKERRVVGQLQIQDEQAGDEGVDGAVAQGDNEAEDAAPGLGRPAAVEVAHVAHPRLLWRRHKVRVGRGLGTLARRGLTDPGRHRHRRWSARDRRRHYDHASGKEERRRPI